MTRAELIATLQRMAAWGGPDGDRLNEAVDMLEADGELLTELAAVPGRRGCAYDATGDPFEVFTMSVPADWWHHLQRMAKP